MEAAFHTEFAAAQVQPPPEGDVTEPAAQTVQAVGFSPSTLAEYELGGQAAQTVLAVPEQGVCTISPSPHVLQSEQPMSLVGVQPLLRYRPAGHEAEQDEHVPPAEPSEDQPAAALQTQTLPALDQAACGSLQTHVAEPFIPLDEPAVHG